MWIINNSKSSGQVLSLRDINSSDLMLWLINNSKSSGPVLPLLNISSLDSKGCGLSIIFPKIFYSFVMSTRKRNVLFYTCYKCKVTFGIKYIKYQSFVYGSFVWEIHMKRWCFLTYALLA